AAVFAIVVLGISGPAVPILAVAAGLAVALAIYALSFRGGVAGTRLILVGIGVAAMLHSFIAYTLSRAPAWDLQQALRWLTGSVNGAQLGQALPLLAVLALAGGVLLSRSRDLEALRMGEDTAAALVVRVGLTRTLVIACAVGMIAVATAITGPIAVVAFLSGPIAARIIGSGGSLLLPSALVGAALVLVGDYCGQFLMPGRYPVGVVTGAPIAARIIGSGGSLLLPSALVGAALVLVGDYCGQFLMPGRYPVGVVTGALGAPYLIYLIVRVNRAGGSL
ncbi:iron chelate uptake ABC transporter family permease subunit, partial [Paracoccus sp. PXZ]